MKQITPNLKKIKILCNSSDTINALLETLENLESVKIEYNKWKISSEKFFPNVKYLDVARLNYLSAEQISKTFPNLKSLEIEKSTLDEEPKSFLVTLLSKLKQLKTLRLRLEIWTDRVLDRESVLQCFQQHGKHLEDVQVDFQIFLRGICST
jgi:ribosome assembly protein YihI (activator of Der GTPase)